MLVMNVFVGHDIRIANEQILIASYSILTKSILILCSPMSVLLL